MDDADPDTDPPPLQPCKHQMPTEHATFRALGGKIVRDAPKNAKQVYTLGRYQRRPTDADDGFLLPFSYYYTGWCVPGIFLGLISF